VNQALNDAPPWFADTLARLVGRNDLSEGQMGVFMRELMAGRCGEMEAASVLIGLHMKGESAEEMATAALVLREHMVRLKTGRDDVLDACGTGGESARTFNISTAAALAAAGAGAHVVKHGNRAASSPCGSADVLAALGVNLEGDAAIARRCLAHAGLAFCFAPHFHPAMRHVAALRRKLGVRTVFNCIGPLANPAEAPYQLLGVGRLEWLDPLAGAVARLGVRRPYLVHAHEGLDEVSLGSPTHVREVRRGTVRALEWQPRDFGLEPCSMTELRVGGIEDCVATIRGILNGEQGPRTRVVIANAAAALLAAERVTTLAEGVARAAEALSSGCARQVLERLIASSTPSAELPKAEN